MMMHGIKRRAYRGIAATVLGVGAAIFVAPSVTLAQEKVDKEQVPQKVRNARQEAAPQGSDVEWYRITQGGQTVYIAQFKGGGEAGKRREMRIAEDGKVVQAPADATNITPAPARAGGGVAAAESEEERLLIENEQLAAELERVQRLREEEKELQTAQARGGRNQSPEIQARRAKQREQRMKTLDERQQQISQRQREVQQRLDTLASSRRTERDRLGAAERTRLDEQDRLIREKARARREQEQARLERELDLTDDRAEAAAGTNVRYRGITADDVPESVREKMATYTRGKEDLRYRRELRGDEISYSVHYVEPRDNKRYWVSIDEDGRVLSEPRLSRYQPGTDTDVRLAGERRTGGSGDGRTTQIAKADVPRRALAALDKETSGARDLQYRREVRDGRTTYSVHYVQPNGKRYFMSVNEDGSTVVEPRISDIQQGERPDRRD